MRLVPFFIIIGGILLQSAAGQAQQSTLSLLQQKYMDFDYPAVINTGNMILRTAENLSCNDSVEIYRLQGLSYYSLADMTDAMRCFSSILQILPDYKLRPRDNPPKVIDFFEEIRQTMLKSVSTNQQKNQVEESNFSASAAATVSQSTPAGLSRAIGFSLLMPGLGHLQYNTKSKGWILLCSGLLTLGSSVYFAIDTNRKEDAYLAASSEDEIAAKYKDYNNAYKIRNTSLILYSAVWLYSQLDLLYWSKPYQNNLSLYAGYQHSGLACLTLQICF